MASLGFYTLCREDGRAFKNTSSDTDLITLNLKKKLYKDSWTELTNSRFKHSKLQRISNSHSNWTLHAHPQGQLLHQLQASGARRCPTTSHMKCPTLFCLNSAFRFSAVFPIYANCVSPNYDWRTIDVIFSVI